MDLPSTRELELEALLQQRNSQISELNDEVSRLRRYVSTQSTPSDADSVTLPAPALAILGPHLRRSEKDSTPGSSTVVNALIQRSRHLQEENDELYEILKLKETGKLKEEVRGLRRVVQRLEGGLRDSHKVINELSTELDKTYEALMTSSKQIQPSYPPSDTRNPSRSPRNTFRDSASNHSSSAANGPHKLPPTGPRAYKKPRLSDPSPPPPSSRQPPHAPHSSNQPRGATIGSTQSHNAGPDTKQRGRDYPRNTSSSYNNKDRDREHEGPGGTANNKAPPTAPVPAPQTIRPSSSNMDVDDDKRGRKRQPPPDREREKERGRGRDRDRDRDRSHGDAVASNGGAVDKDGHEKGARERDHERSTAKDRGKERGGRERDRDRERENRASQSAGGGGGTRRNGAGYTGSYPGRGGGANHQRRGHNEHRASSGPGVASSNSHSIDRTLAERMGL
ncbi:hypothetical protein FA15DRAFT_632435 [Coprinopsis marcescibilis]|uniref:Uncharacterized protein n=1 Tax=Coprinopsis marcescibilis TaxID=230819 RepID=A0A5C3L8N7_COPMA|nr:hypothetical protein FA15DRAFT_632435 [Coprinopsis marcescibilis]